MDALFSRDNIFPTPKTSVKQIPSQDLISDTPFLAFWSTGPMESPAVLDDHSKSKKEEHKDKQKGHKSQKDKDIKHSRKRDWADSPVHHKATTSTQARALFPPAGRHTLCTLFHRMASYPYLSTFESDFTEPDKSNNTWKGKNLKEPTRISVAMPPDGWLCQKLERLNLTVAGGYPSRAQDSAGLKKDQFVKVPKTQSCWYKMHMLKPKEPNRPGHSIFSWHNAEAKVNSQIPRVTKDSAYPSTGPPSRQEYFRRWEKCEHEDSYIVNHVAGLIDGWL